MRVHFLLLLPLFLFACSSEDTTSTASVNPTAGGTGGAGGNSSGGAGSGGEEPGGQSQGGAGSGGKEPGGGSGGSIAGNSGEGGFGGKTDCCADVLCSGDHPMCVEGSCFDLKPGQCFNDSDCGGKACKGATICPCGAMCILPTTPGKCEGATISDWSSCGVPGDCTVLANSCCGTCQMPTLNDLDAVNRMSIKEHFQDVCPNPGPCPTCIGPQNPDIMAGCALGQGKCLLLEVSKSAFSACDKDEDCLLRTPQCCSCGVLPKEQLVAINQKQNAAYSTEIGCGSVGCTPCKDSPTPPKGVKAVCDQKTKHCRITP